MYFYWFYLIFITSSNAFTNFNNFYKNQTLSLNNVQILSQVLEPISHINLQLKTVNDANNPFVKYFLEQKICSITIKICDLKCNHFFSNYNNLDGIVLLSDELNSHNVLKTVPENFDAIFIITLTSNLNDVNKFENDSQILWQQRGIYRIYFLTLIEIYWYNPFAYNLNKSNFTYGKITNFNERDFKNLFANLNGYPISFQIFRSVYAQLIFDENSGLIESVRGPDGNVAYLLEKLMNFTLVLQEPDSNFFGYRLNNGSFVGAIGRIIRKEADASFTGFFVKDYLTRDIEFTVTVYTDDLCCYLPKASRIPQSILPLFSVRWEIWAGFILTGFLSAFMWMIIRKLNVLTISGNLDLAIQYNYVSGFSQYMRIFLDTWVVWVRVNINKFPPFLSERVLVLSLCLISVIFGAIFESSLATVYIHPLYYKDINTLKELDLSGNLIFYKHAAMKDDVFTGNSNIFRNLQKKMKLANDSRTPIIEKMYKIGGFASVTRSSSLYLDDIAYFITQKIHKIPECPRRYKLSYILHRNSPYTEIFNRWLLQFLNAGLIDHWIDLTLYEAKLNATKNIQFNLSHDFKVLTLKDLQLGFYVILLGGTLANLSLLFEIFLHKRKYLTKYS